MTEDHESPAARDVIGIIDLPLRFQPLDVSLKLAKSRVHMVGKFIGRLQPFAETVDFALCCLKGCLIFRRKFHRMRVGAPHAMRVREIKMDFGPFPALGLAQRIPLRGQALLPPAGQAAPRPRNSRRDPR